ADSKEQPHEEGEEERSSLEHQPGDHESDQAEAHYAIFAERDVLAGHLEPLAEQCGLRDQRRSKTFEPAPALCKELQDLGLRIAGDGVPMALLDELNAPLDGLRGGRSAHGQIGQRKNPTTTDQE